MIWKALLSEQVSEKKGGGDECQTDLLKGVVALGRDKSKLENKWNLNKDENIFISKTLQILPLKLWPVSFEHSMMY